MSVDVNIMDFYKKVHGSNVIDSIIADDYVPYINTKEAYPYMKNSLFLIYEGRKPLDLRSYCISYPYGTDKYLVLNRVMTEKLLELLDLVVVA